MATNDTKSITVSPFYHSAVNAVTRPNQLVGCSKYFVDRWMPLLGGNGTVIILALRRLGYFDQRTGEKRDEIAISAAELSSRTGISHDTIRRELGIETKTGRPKNPYLHEFVKVRAKFTRDPKGKLNNEGNCYWVSMDDPVHPDDWARVEEAVLQLEEKELGRKAPGTQSAFLAENLRHKPGTQSAFSVSKPGTQIARPVTQIASPGTQIASDATQNASCSIVESYTLNTLNTLSTSSEVSLSLAPEGKDYSGHIRSIDKLEPGGWAYAYTMKNVSVDKAKASPAVTACYKRNVYKIAEPKKQELIQAGILSEDDEGEIE